MKKKLMFYSLCFLLVIFMGIIYYYNDIQVPILGYHGILPNELNNENNQFIIDSEKFEKQLKILKKLGYKTLTLDEYYCWQQKKCKKSHHAVLITFDDGYQNNYDYAFPLLKKYDMNAVVFYIGKNAYNDGNMFMDLEKINKAKEEYPNIEFASHTYERHEERMQYYDEVIADIEKMNQVLPTQYIAYPHGDYTDEYIDALKDSRYIMAFTFGPGKEHRKSNQKDNPYKIPRLNIDSKMSDIKFILKVMLPI